MKILVIILLVLLVLSLLVISYLLISPVKILIDSRNGVLYFGWNRWLNAKVDEQGNQWCLKVTVPFWKKRYAISELIASRRKTRTKAVVPRDKDTSGSKLSWRKIRRIFHHIKIVEFKWILDTDDFIWNAYLTPVFQILNMKRGYRTQINFVGKNEIKIVAQSRMINMLRVSIL